MEYRCEQDKSLEVETGCGKTLSDLASKGKKRKRFCDDCMKHRQKQHLITCLTKKRGNGK